MLVSTYRVTKFAFQNFWRNFWLSVITVSMLILTLITINILLVLNVVTEKAIALVEDRIEVSVYFNQTTSDETLTGAIAYLRGLSQVRDVMKIDAQTAYDNFVARHAGDEEILASLQELGENPFGSMLVVKAYSAEDFDFIIDALNNPQFQNDIRDKDFSNYESIVKRIRDITDKIRTFGIVLSLVFLSIAILIVFNTVRIGMFIHREEIGIMRLVGASNWFIKAPFYIEMIFLSFIATLVVPFLMYLMIVILESRLGMYFGAGGVGLYAYFVENGLIIYGIQFLALVAITIFSTGLAMKKHLRV